MANIGTTLRDTRIRNKIDISSVEQATKIRAKYLRALENEEWAVLPGPTYVKSFLRTYAEFLGIDPYVLIEEYNARFEEPEELEVPAFRREAPLRDQVRRVGPPSRAVAAIVVGVLFLGFIIFLGVTGPDEKKSPDSGRAPAKPPESVQPRPATTKRKPAGNVVSVKVVPSKEVWVCLVNAKGKAKINAQVLAAGDARGPYRSKSFRVTIGNGGGDLVVNGRRKNVPETSKPVGYSITTDGVRSLPQSKQPGCGA